MLELQKISYQIKGGSREKILDHILLKFKAGEFVAITGPNGSGKSTLANLIMGIKTPTEGQILLEKEDITNLNITKRAKLGIAYSFQQPVIFKGIRVYDLLCVASGELISPETAAKHLKAVGLKAEDYLSREINDKLSGGELKRIEIASILARDAKLIIFDEPEAGIDLWSFDNLIKIFQKLKKAGKTIIVISHQEKLLKLADKIVILGNGKIKYQGIPTETLLNLTGDEDGIN